MKVEDPELLELTAVHEAGHAVCDVIHGFAVRKVTIKPRRGITGRCVSNQVVPVQRLREKVRGFCAGYLAEILLHPNDADHETAQPDFEEAAELLRVLFPGQDITSEVGAVYDETAAILSTETNIRAIRLVADDLLKHTTINGQRVKDLVLQTYVEAVSGKAGGQ